MNSLKKVIYFGSPSFSAQILESLISNPPTDTKVVGVVTQPDKPTGRKQVITPSPVAQLATQHHLPVFKPSQLDAPNLTHLKLLTPDIFLVAAYGKIIPSSWLHAPNIATLNIHFSLLPKYRGALCVSEPIKNGDQTTGVTLMQMDEQLDHGPIISSSKQTIDINDNTESLTNKLTQKTIALLHTNLPKYLNKTLTPKPQNHGKATTTPFIKTHNHKNAFIPWKQITSALKGTKALPTHNLIRSANPDPGTWTTIPTKNKGKLQVKILQTKLQKGHLLIQTIQLPGKSPISWQQFLSGHQL